MKSCAKYLETPVPNLQDDEFYMENGNFVLTEHYLWRRGYCCGNGCRHCPFDYQAVPERTRQGLHPPRFYFGKHPGEATP